MLTLPDILLIITALCDIGLALFVRSRNRTSKINFFLGLFSICLALWGIVLVGYDLVPNGLLALYLMKSSYVIALIIAVSYYFFSKTFPEDKNLGRWEELLVFIPASIFIVLILSIPSFMTHGIVTQSWGKEAILGVPEYMYFACMFTYLFVGGLLRICLKFFKAEGTLRLQLLAIGGSVGIAGIAGMYFNLILPSPFFENFRYIWSGPLFTFLIAVVITYSIFRLKFFNPKAVLAEFLVYALALFVFVRFILSNSTSDLFINGILLVVVGAVGTLLVKSVTNEVEQRETIEKQELELEGVNKQQENLLHFISHEIKGYLTKSEAGFAAIAQGDFGAVSPELGNMATSALTEVRKGVRTVMDILDASNLKRGTVSYKKKEFDLRDVVTYVVDHLKPAIEEKHLTVDMHLAWELPCKVEGDEEKIRDHVIRNLIDNAIKYTPSGSFKVSVVRKGSIVQFAVQDSGVGITEEDKKRLFTEGGHGKDSIKVNVHSTGYGLYIAKTIVDAHGGRIWAESDGAGKGSRFVIELPAV